MPFKKGDNPGPGRPKGSRNGSSTAIEWAEKRGGWELLIRMAEGKEPGFAKSPKVRADLATYLMDRAYGRATEMHELSGPGGEPMTVNIVSFKAAA